MKNVYLDSGDGIQGSCQTCPHIADKGCPLHSATILARSRSLRKLKKNKGALQPLQKVMYSSILNSPYFSSGGNIRCPGCAGNIRCPGCAGISVAPVVPFYSYICFYILLNLFRTCMRYFPLVSRQPNINTNIAMLVYLYYLFILTIVYVQSDSQEIIETSLLTTHLFC